ncbi:hypothetical protein HJC99_00545 [Candidatus Saccharibacteria bacterium]|nr:hypothetical protein [Candidatus Saccharibacteria bacterium]
MTPAKTIKPFYACVAVTLVSALISFGFALAALGGSGDGRINAMYAGVRSLAILIMLLIVVSKRSKLGLITLAGVMILVQAGDSVVGGLNNQLIKTLGPACLAIVNTIVLIPLARTKDERL